MIIIFTIVFLGIQDRPTYQETILFEIYALGQRSADECKRELDKLIPSILNEKRLTKDEIKNLTDQEKAELKAISVHGAFMDIG